jgi:hypothetical protein
LNVLNSSCDYRLERHSISLPLDIATRITGQIAMPDPVAHMPNVRPPNKWCPELGKIISNAVLPYQPHEIAVSRTEGGHLVHDVVTIGNADCRYLVIRDFGVDWRHLKAATRSLLLTELSSLETDTSLQFQVVGYSDCAGSRGNNLHLRLGRARYVFDLLGPSARARVIGVKAASPETYLANNSTVKARAENRAVVIEIFADPAGSEANANQVS